MLALFDSYRIHHVGIVLPTLETAEAFLKSFDMVEDFRGFVDQWSCWCVFAKGADGALIELVVAEDGPLKRFNKGTGGVHHFAYEVADIHAVSDELVRRGMMMLEPAPIRGAGDFLCNFIHPISTYGVQIELVQPL